MGVAAWVEEGEDNRVSHFAAEDGFAAREVAELAEENVDHRPVERGGRGPDLPVLKEELDRQLCLLAVCLEATEDLGHGRDEAAGIAHELGQGGVERVEELLKFFFRGVLLQKLCQARELRSLFGRRERLGCLDLPQNILKTLGFSLG
jgi:hypothetical protein